MALPHNFPHPTFTALRCRPSLRGSCAHMHREGADAIRRSRPVTACMMIRTRTDSMEPATQLLLLTSGLCREMTPRSRWWAGSWGPVTSKEPRYVFWFPLDTIDEGVEMCALWEGEKMSMICVATTRDSAPAPSSDTMAEQLAGEPLVQCCAAVAGAAEHWRNNCSACSAVAESLTTRTQLPPTAGKRSTALWPDVLIPVSFNPQLRVLTATPPQQKHDTLHTTRCHGEHAPRSRA